jgi:hypothetical protein
MINPIRLYDYIYFRIVDFFLDKDLPVQDTAWANLALLQSLTILDIWIVYDFITGMTLSAGKFPAWIILVLMIVGGLNWWRYTRHLGMRKLLSFWRDEGAKKKQWRGAAIIIYMVLAVIIAVTWGLIKTLRLGIG